MREILVTGGADYIGSHTTLSLLQAGFDVLVLDNLSNIRLTSRTRKELVNFVNQEKHGQEEEQVYRRRGQVRN